MNYAAGVFDTYVYEKNLQGDIVAVYSSAGTKLVSYAYDAYGSCTVTYYNNGASTQAASNPFRYRGYYYDSDLGLYYLNSRYYDANTGRFISPDALSYLGANGDLISYNLYAYCSNNPVMYVDPTGQLPQWIENAIDWIEKKWEKITAVANIVLTKDFLQYSLNSITYNFEADVGISIGIGLENKICGVSVEAISRMDIIGLQIKNKKLRIGHDGRSALSVGIGNFSIGPQNDTFEALNGDPDDPSHKDIDYGKAYGRAASFGIGYHYNISFSYIDFKKDIIDYIEKRLNRQ